MNTNDPRVQRTRDALHEAMIELIIEQGYEEVTVRQISARAGIGFKTFYRHYDDKNDLMAKITQKAMSELQKVMSIPTDLETAEQNAIKGLRFAKNYSKLLKALFRSPMADVIMEPFATLALVEGYQHYEHSRQRTDKLHDVPADLVAYHFMSNVLQLFRWWVENDMPYPPEEMGYYINRLVIYPIWGITESRHPNWVQEQQK